MGFESGYPSPLGVSVAGCAAGEGWDGYSELSASTSYPDLSSEASVRGQCRG